MTFRIIQGAGFKIKHKICFCRLLINVVLLLFFNRPYITSDTRLALEVDWAPENIVVAFSYPRIVFFLR